MKHTLTSLFLKAQTIDRRTVQIIYAILVLTMLVLGAGAPDDGGLTVR
ncbi:MAG TPA: hypothetical protein VIO61_02755 [Anaerolineaceae bacterium]